MAEPIHMWDNTNLLRVRQECQARLEIFWQDRNQTLQSLEEMAVQHFMFSIDDELRSRMTECNCCGTRKLQER